MSEQKNPSSSHPGRVMLRGLAAVLPAVLTLYILFWLGATAERLLGGMIQVVLPRRWYWPGMGLAAGLALAYGIGLLLEGWFMRRLLDWSELLLNRIPLIKTVYGSVKDLTGFFSGAKERQFGQAVMVEIENNGTRLRLLGFVTRTDFAGLPAGIGGPDMVAVYLPMSYQIGGYTLILPRTAVHPIPMAKQEAMRFALTAGMSTEELPSDKRNAAAPR